MALNKYKFSKTRKSVIAALCALTVTCTGLAAACSDGSGGDNGSSSSSFKREDTVQLLKNGSFENYSVPKDAVYLIKNTDSWSNGGDKSNAMSGIIGTSEKAWKALTDEGLKDKLDYNNDLSSSDEDYDDKYVDYNGMKSRDILYRDTYSALLKDDEVKDSFIENQGYEKYFGIVKEDGKSTFRGEEVKQKDDEEYREYYFVEEEGLGKSVRYSLIDNPKTHYNLHEDADGKLCFTDENGKTLYVYEEEESGDYYYYPDNDEENEKVFISNVLMVHNYPSDSKYNGIQQYYTSQTITLGANTAAEISLWVKTAELRFDKGYSQMSDQDRGAFIEVTQTVNGSSVSSFIIKAINTEKIIADHTNENGEISLDSESNGWLKYTVYVNACDFGESNITLRLGLGQDSTEKVTGYAFFDDVSVTKFRSLDDQKCTYSENEGKLDNTTCTLTTKEENKIFIADRALSDRNIPERYKGDKKRSSEDFFYLVDLASENGDVTDKYSAVNFTASNTTADFTTEKEKSKYYSSANVAPTDVTAVKNGFGNYIKPSTLTQFRTTSQDIIGAFNSNTAFPATGLYPKLTEDLLGEKGLSGLPKIDEENTTDKNMLVMLSANGAAYTLTVEDSGSFTVEKDAYKIVSFWVKTSDMKGNTAATVKIKNVNDKSKDEEKSIVIDTTGKTTDFDKTEKDVYNGWVQCFFFVENDTDENQEFKIEFSFGNTSIIDTTVNSYKHGWAALANMQTLDFTNEDIYSLTSDNDYAQQFTFADEDDSDSDEEVMDEPAGTSDIKTGIASPANYKGVIGGSSAVSQGTYKAGLINRDHFADYDNDYILQMFNASDWDKAFPDSCYQPLVILSNLPAYAANAAANANTYKNYYVKDAEGDISINGETFRKVNDTDVYDEKTTYYSIGTNYGFVGSNMTISADSYETISVKVKVSGAGVEANVYLVDSDTREVLSYTTPEYAYYYDDEGNVLDEKFDEDWTDSQHKNHVVYTLLDNGLYKDKDGIIRANLNNLTKAYKYYEFETKFFYKDEAHTERVAYDDLESGKTYYDENGEIAPHYLVNSDGKRVYKFVNGEYYYIVNGEVSNQRVQPFHEDKYRRYEEPLDIKYAVKVTADDCNGEWVNVNFFVRTGSKEKNYRLELWCGQRDEAGELTAAPEGAVAFDIGEQSITAEEKFNEVRKQFEDEIIGEYQKLLANHPDVLANENIEYYEDKIAEFDDIDQDKLDALKAKYAAYYYSYTLYDDTSYIPFNAETAKEGETGYDYKITDEEYAEKLAYLRYDEEGSFNVFMDYSAVDQNIEIGTASDDTDEDEETPETDWLIITSIILVVALMFTLISIIARDLVKKFRKKQGVKAQSKNMYRKRERYIKKLHLVKNEPESGEPESGEEESPAETEEVPEEEPSEETPAETEEPSNDTPEE